MSFERIVKKRDIVENGLTGLYKVLIFLNVALNRSMGLT